MYTTRGWSWRPRAALWVALGIALGGCVGTDSRDDGPGADDFDATTEGQPARPAADARAYRVVPGESEFEIHVYRDGRLARLGHNHVVASTNLEGTLWLADPVAASVVELVIDKASFTVDEAERRADAGEGFEKPVPDEAVAGTRNNMLSADLLSGELFPSVSVRTLAVEGEWPELRLTAQIMVRDTPKSLTLPMTVTREGDRIRAQGSTRVTHEELALVPFSVMLGALRVREEMLLYYSVVAQACEGSCTAAPLASASPIALAYDAIDP
ncbi:MAG: YceI family protein, partial [Pseudomonadota bacterium]